MRGDLGVGWEFEEGEQHDERDKGNSMKRVMREGIDMAL